MRNSALPILYLPLALTGFRVVNPIILTLTPPSLSAQSGYFWCTVVRQHAARSWYAVLPSLRAAYWVSASSELSAQTPALEAARGHRSRSKSLEYGEGRVIHVGIHHRSVKRRRFSNFVYHTLLDAVRARHSTHVAAVRRAASGPGMNGGGGLVPRLSLRIHVHSDQTLEPEPTTAEERAQRRAKPGLLLTVACADANKPDAVLSERCTRRAGVRVYTPREIADPLASMHHLAQMDLLILSESSFSAVPALLGNMSVLLPMCNGPQIYTSRSPLPHWTPVPCTGNLSEVSSILDKMPWPPPRNVWP